MIAISFLPFKRSFAWFQRAFAPAFPTASPTELVDVVHPVVDVFGTERLQDLRTEQFIENNATGGFFEATFPKVDPGRCRYYPHIHYTHDDSVAQPLKPILVHPEGGFFISVGLRDTIETPPGFRGHLHIQDVWVGPNEFLGLQGITNPAANLIMVTLFVDLPLGESHRFSSRSA